MGKYCCLCRKKIGHLDFNEFSNIDEEKSFIMCADCTSQNNALENVGSVERTEAAIQYFKPVFSNVDVEQDVKNILSKKIIAAQKKMHDEKKRQEKEAELEAERRKELEEARKESEKNKSSLICEKLITTGNNFEGYRIIKYRGLVSGEVALGTGFVSEISSGFSDLFGSQSNIFADKIRAAKKAAQTKLIDNVILVGGNAVIGVEFDYIIFGENMIGVCANGTAVSVEKINDDCDK